MTSLIPIEVTPYDPEWPEKFQREKDRIYRLIRPYINTIEHIGSTAVPGLAAKPVIDILIAVTSLNDDVHFIPPLENLGYEYIQKHEDVFPQRRYLHLIRGGKHLFHLHMVEPASDFFRDQLLFRDHLRNHPEDARAYAALKLELAQKFRQDREAYTDGKSGFILGILASEKKEIINS
jgi:GrpB-like predicted nucleotidyltransferase (UPF0157 family)